MGMRRWVQFMILAVLAVFATPTCLWFNRFLDNDSILTQDEKDVIGTKLEESDDPLRDGSFLIGDSVDNIYNEELTDTQTSREKTTRYIKGPINYFLWIVGLFALIYLIYHGLLTVMSGSDEEQQKKWLAGVKFGAIAIIGLGVTWFLLSLIFWLINIVTEAV